MMQANNNRDSIIKGISVSGWKLSFEFQWAMVKLGALKGNKSLKLHEFESIKTN